MKTENLIRTKSFEFALNIIIVYKKLIVMHEYTISRQLLKSATSIGANVEEADAAQSKKDFIAKMSIASKEARETHYWLRLLKYSQIVQGDYDLQILASEELIRIITAILRTAKNNLEIATKSKV